MENLRELFKKVFDVDLPISGGFGQSIDDPIVVHADNSTVGVKMEYQIIGFLQELAGNAWHRGEQTLIRMGGKSFDKVSISLEDPIVPCFMSDKMSPSDKESVAMDIAPMQQDYYFDITEFMPYRKSVSNL